MKISKKIQASYLHTYMSYIDTYRVLCLSCFNLATAAASLFATPSTSDPPFYCVFDLISVTSDTTGARSVLYRFSPVQITFFFFYHSSADWSVLYVLSSEPYSQQRV